MFKKKGLLVLGAALLVVGVTSCGSNVIDDGNDYDVSDTVGKDLVLSVIGSGDTYGNWDAAATGADGSAQRFTKIYSTHYQFTCTAKVEDEFKVHQDTAWTSQYGVEDMDWTKSTTGIVTGTSDDYTEGASNRSNFKLLKGGAMTIDFYPYYFIGGTYTGPLVVTII